jgi:hypothetical protein
MSRAQAVHKTFLRTAPTEYQLELYEREARGVSTKDRSPEVLDAILFIALSQAKEGGTNEVFHPVTVVIPVTEKPWVMERIYNLAKGLTERVKQAKERDRAAGKPIDTKSSMRTAFTWMGYLHLGCPSSWENFPAPERWVAIGYTKEDAIPGWMRDALV